MLIHPHRPGSREPAPGKQDKGAPRPEGFWSELTDDLREWLVHLDSEKVEDFGRVIKSAGSGMKGAWKQVRDIPRKLLNLPVVRDTVGEEDVEKWSNIALVAAKGVGFGAAGGHAVSGVVKALQGKKRGDHSRLLDGLVDACTGVVIAASVAGLGLARAIAAPIGASLNVLKGAFNAARGFQERDQRKQLQGVLDSVRSAGSVGRLLSSHHTALRVAGIGLAPVAGVLQAGRGMHDIATGLRNDDNKKELKGMVDVAAAVGTALAFASGAAIIPGVALAVVANLAKVAYQVSPKARAKMDKGIDKIEPHLEKAVETAERVTEPIRQAWKTFMGRWFKRVDADSPDKMSRAQLAEVAGLLHSDGTYARREEDRLKVVLEKLGQRSELPSRKEPAPPTRRNELRAELTSKPSRLDFLRFMLVVADYDFEVKGEETAYLDNLARDLSITPSEMERLRKERDDGEPLLAEHTLLHRR